MDVQRLPPHPSHLRHLRATNAAGCICLSATMAATITGIWLSVRPLPVWWRAGQLLLAASLVQWFIVCTNAATRVVQYTVVNERPATSRLPGAIPFEAWSGPQCHQKGPAGGVDPKPPYPVAHGTTGSDWSTGLEVLDSAVSVLYRRTISGTFRGCSHCFARNPSPPLVATGALAAVTWPSAHSGPRFSRVFSVAPRTCIDGRRSPSHQPAHARDHGAQPGQGRHSAPASTRNSSRGPCDFQRGCHRCCCTSMRTSSTTCIVRPLSASPQFRIHPPTK